MATAIVYYSAHHGNTKKLVDAIAAKHEVNMFDITQTPSPDLERYDTIGLASGIYYFKFHKSMIKLASTLPEGRRVFLLFTCGSMSEKWTRLVRAAAQSRGAKIVGEYGCVGFDTFGPLKLLGGFGKGRPSADEIAGAVEFYERLVLSEER